MRLATQVLLTTVLLLAGSPAWPAPPTPFQNGLEGSLGFSAADIAEAEAAAVVKEIAKESGPRSLSIAGVIRVAASPSRVADQVRSDRGLVKGTAQEQSGSFSDPAVPADVASYRLPESDLEVIEICKVGACKFKMGKSAIERFEKLDWSASDAPERATALTHELMVGYANAYREKGMEGLVVYADKRPPVSSATSLRRLLAEGTYVEHSLPALERHLEGYPNVETPGAEDSIYWSTEDYGYRPVTGVTHAVFYESPGVGPGDPAAVVVNKHIFASHYFDARVELIALFKDDANAKSPGTYVVYVDRSLFDGEVGGIKRHLLVRSALASVRERMDTLRERFAAAD